MSLRSFLCWTQKERTSQNREVRPLSEIVNVRKAESLFDLEWYLSYNTHSIRFAHFGKKKVAAPSIGSDKIRMLLDIIRIPFFTAIGNNGLQKLYRNKILADRGTVVFYILIDFFTLLIVCGFNIDENLFCGRLIEEKAAARNLDSDAITVAVSDYDSYIFLYVY